MNAIKKEWFSELSDLWPGQCMSLKVNKVLHEEKSDYQDIAVLETLVFSNTFFINLTISLL